eukprot:scaffold49158_cov23-Tisochrysis_lutea.AAC.1
MLKKVCPCGGASCKHNAVQHRVMFSTGVAGTTPALFSFASLSVGACLSSFMPYQRDCHVDGATPHLPQPLPTLEALW